MYKIVGTKYRKLSNSYQKQLEKLFKKNFRLLSLVGPGDSEGPMGTVKIHSEVGTLYNMGDALLGLSPDNKIEVRQEFNISGI